MIKKKLKGTINFKEPIEVEFDVEVDKDGYITQISAPKEFTPLLKQFEDIECRFYKKKK